MLLHDRQGVLATLMLVGNPPDQTRSLLLGCTPQDVSIHRDVGLVARPRINLGGFGASAWR